MKSFFSGVKKEVSRVKWPDRKYMVKSSAAVILFGLFISLFFYIIDLTMALVRSRLG